MNDAGGVGQHLWRSLWPFSKSRMLVIATLIGVFSIGSSGGPSCASDGRYEYDQWSYLVSDVPQSLAPQWSLDGRHIVFTNLDDPEAVWPNDDLYSIRSDGSRLLKVADDARWPSISPDGSHITYSTTRDHQRLPYYIGTSALNGSDRDRLTEQSLKYAPTGLNDISPAWSPDGQRIAFARFTRDVNKEGRGIYVMNSDGSAQYQAFRLRSGEEVGEDGILVTDVFRWGPVWSPDGEKLAFVVREYTRGSPYEFVNDYRTETVYEFTNRYVLYTINPDGSGLTRAFAATRGSSKAPASASIDGIPGSPAWSPDGQKLAFSRNIPVNYKDFAAGEEIGAPPGAILNTINLDGSGLLTVFESSEGRRIESLSWSPNGKDILFTLSEENTPPSLVGSSVYIAAADGSGGYRKVAGGAFASWSPDGSRIAVIDFSDAYLSTMAPDGSDVQVLVRRDEQADLKAANR